MKTIATKKDALNKAFRNLRKHGLIALQATDLHEEVVRARVVADGYNGFVTYSKDDAEVLREQGEVLLDFGANCESEDLGIGGQIRNALEAVGLRVIWDGDWSPILVDCR